MQASPVSDATSDALSPTGVEGLDLILHGGFPANRLYLLRGMPGTGKTTLALQYLLTGVAAGEPALYITLSETKEEVEAVARSHGWRLDGIAIFELSALEEQLKQEAQNTVFHVSEIELNRTTEALLAKIDEVKPRRVAIDSLSELRMLAESPLRYRRQMLALKQYFAGRKITVLLLEDHAGTEGDLHVQSIAHGVISLDQQPTDYGAKRRRIEINKLRGVDFLDGFHDVIIVHGGLRVFPRLVAADHRFSFDPTPLKSGNAELDLLIGGGIERGTSCLLLGPAGAGKSSMAMQFAAAAAQRGEKTCFFMFDENEGTLLRRGDALCAPFRGYVDDGTIQVQQINPGELSPGHFVHLAQRCVEEGGTRVIVIDSLNGYMQAMPAVSYLTIQLHELQAFFAHFGVVTFMTVAQHGILGSMQSPFDITYLADTVLLLRYFEQSGQIRKAISVVKKRDGYHENAIREFKFDQRGMTVGEPLSDFQGVLTGVPVFSGARAKMLGEK